MAFLHFLEAQPDHMPPSSRLPSFTLHGHRPPPLACSLGLSRRLHARLFVLSTSSTLLSLSLVIGLVSLSRRFHSVVLRL
ncbi:hypothetical protein NQZ68_004664 [Dissostichus eleginoides]|nr:hypothetical protein NQZ68_004664 [Dissostichus eleginoides]